jgi:hypothetical protein
MLTVEELQCEIQLVPSNIKRTTNMINSIASSLTKKNNVYVERNS